MKFTVEQQDLAWGLQAVSRAVSSRTTLPVLSGILLEAAENHLVLTGTDLELAVRVSIPAACERSGSVVLPAKYLTEFTRRIPSGAISVSVDSGEQRAILRWQKSEYTIHGYAADQFPAMADEQAANGLLVRFPQDLLRNVVQQTAFAVSTDETRPTLTGVHLQAGGNGLRATATDGFRVAMSRDSNIVAEHTLDVIVPGRALSELLRVGGNDVGSVEVRLAGNLIHFQFDNLQMASRLVDGEFPKISELLPTDYPTKVITDRDELLAAAERASLLSDSRLSARLIVLNLSADKIEISSQDPEVGQGYEEVHAQLSGEPLRIGLNARYLADGLKVMPAGQIVLEFIDPVKAVRITPADDDSYEYIVFPVRI